MTVLEARPQGIFLNCGYRVYQGKQVIAKIKFSHFGSGGQLIIPPHRYKIKLSGAFLRNTTQLMQGKTCIASAKRALVPPVIRLDYGNHHYQINVAEMREAKVIEDGKVVGTVHFNRSWWSRKVQFDLPNALPQTMQLFLVWMVLEHHSFS